MSKDKQASESPEPELRAPEEWCARRQLYALTRKHMGAPQTKIPCWQHACASAMGGWAQHRHDADAPFLLSEADYLAALKAAEAPPYRPPLGAISPYCTLTHAKE